MQTPTYMPSIVSNLIIVRRKRVVSWFFDYIVWSTKVATASLASKADAHRKHAATTLLDEVAEVQSIDTMYNATYISYMVDLNTNHWSSLSRP